MFIAASNPGRCTVRRPGTGRSGNRPAGLAPGACTPSRVLRCTGSSLVLRVSSFAWSISACAGNPCRISFVMATLSIYPRVCGGSFPAPPLGDTDTDLSPRVRGIPNGVLDGQTPTGSIPACAGDPRRRKHVGDGKRIYPRVCGGSTLTRRNGRRLPDLSPRVRGIPRSGIWRTRRRI